MMKIRNRNRNKKREKQRPSGQRGLVTVDFNVYGRAGLKSDIAVVEISAV
jgi:hypothetical protein